MSVRGTEMHVRIFCSTGVENIITDEVEFLGYHQESHDIDDIPDRFVVYHFDEHDIEECNKLIGTTDTAESVKDKFLLFLLKKLNGYEIKFEAENDHNVIEIVIG